MTPLPRPSGGRLPAPTRTILPGGLLCEREPQLLGTILGSCVAVCLFDRRLRFGGMCHFILPNCPSNGEDSLRFGDTAVRALVRRMRDLGSDSRTVEAKLFGGANVLLSGTPEYAVGRRNVEIAIAELRRHRIPIVASHLSGVAGLVIRQCTACGSVWVRPVAGRGRGGQAGNAPQDLAWLSDDLAAGMIIRGDDGLPVAIRHRSATTPANTCGVCSGAAYDESAIPPVGYPLSN